MTVFFTSNCPIYSIVPFIRLAHLSDCPLYPIVQSYSIIPSHPIASSTKQGYSYDVTWYMLMLNCFFNKIILIVGKYFLRDAILVVQCCAQ